MTGKEFKNLDIDSKVKYVNNLLKQGNSVDNIRNTLGVGKNYIGNTFTKHGYKLNRNINQYENINIATDTTNVPIEPNTMPVAKLNKANNTNTNENKIKALESKIEDLQKQINIINKRMDEYSSNGTIEINTTKVVTDTTNIIHRDIDSNDKTVARHYRIYNDVHKEFKAFCKSHKQYKVQDIISSAIKEYLDKYNK